MAHPRVIYAASRDARACDATTGRPERDASSHGGTHLAIDARPKSDHHANAGTNADADADAGALAESDG